MDNVRAVQSVHNYRFSASGAMFGSGVKAAKEAIKLYDSYEIVDGEVVGRAEPKHAGQIAV